jgi:hypothetical protein
LEKEEALFFTTAIHQALVIARQVRNGELDLSEREPENFVFTRCYRDGRWLGEWNKAPAPARRREAHAKNIHAIKAAELHLLSSRASKVSETWELDIFVLPIAIRPSAFERPYFPSCFLVVEKNQGLVLDSNLTEPWLTVTEKQDEVIKILKNTKRLPHEIRGKSGKIKEIVEPITTLLGINLRVSPLPMLEQAKESLCRRFSQRYP